MIWLLLAALMAVVAACFAEASRRYVVEARRLAAAADTARLACEQHDHHAAIMRHQADKTLGDILFRLRDPQLLEALDRVKGES
jgi:hypothetical protein